MSNPISWQQIFDLTKDQEVKQAIETLKNFDKVYKKLIKDAGKLKTKYSQDVSAMVEVTKKLDTQIDKLKPTTEVGKKSLIEMSGKADVLTSSFTNLNGKIVALEGTVMKLTKEKNKVNESTKKAVKLQGEEAKLKAKLNTLTKSEAKETARLREKIIEKNKALVEAKGERAIGALMGDAMKELKGKADGSTISRLLKEELAKKAKK